MSKLKGDIYQTVGLIKMAVDENKMNKEFLEFLIEKDEDLSYEFTSVNDVELIFITGKNDNERAISFFNHPRLVEHSKGSYIKEYLFVDTRLYIKKVEGTVNNLASITINAGRLEFDIIRAIIFLKTRSDNLEIEPLKGPTVLLFSTWITQLLTRSFSLTPIEVLRANIILLDYALSMFGLEKMARVVQIDKYTYDVSRTQNNTHLISDVLESIGKNDTIEDLCESLSEGVATTNKLPNFNTQTLYAIIGRSWLGYDVAQMVAVAVQDLPSLVSLFYVNMENNTYRDTVISKVVKGIGKQLDVRHYVGTIARLLEDVKF